MFTKYGNCYRSTLGTGNNNRQRRRRGSATGQPVGTTGQHREHHAHHHSGSSDLLQLFPVHYPRDFNRTADDLQRGERTIEIWFGNSFSNPRPNEHDHDAIDIMTPIGLPVCFTSRQTVVEYWPYDGQSRSGVSTSRRGGHSVRTIDTRGNIHYYAHLRDSASEMSIEPGFTYQAGRVMGFTGDTGIARGNAHLHYQIRSPRPMRRRNRYSMVVRIGGREMLFHSRGRRPINPYDELVRLAQQMDPPAERRGRYSSQYRIPIPER